MIAVNDGKIVKLGQNPQLGNFVVLEDVYGNRYTYSHLASLATRYPVPKPESQAANASAKNTELELPKPDAKPTVPATAGAQPATARAPATAPQASGSGGQAGATGTTASDSSTKERLFAHPERPAAYSAGGKQQLAELGQPLQSFNGYFTGALQLDPRDYVLKPLQAGSSVIAGTILGRIGKTDPALAPHVEFSIRPAGRGAPLVDPKPILDGWKLLESTAIYRANGKNAFAAANGAGPSIGQVLLMSKEQLQQRVLADPNVDIYACGRQDIAAGRIDRRVLATLEFLVASGLKPTVSALECGHSYLTTSGNVSEHSTGDAVDIAAVNGIPIAGHQGSGSITDITIRRLLTLQGAMKPHQIISLMTYPGADNTLALPDHCEPHPRRLPPRGQPARRPEAADDPQAEPVDQAGPAARDDPEPGRPAAGLEVRDQGRPRRLTRPPCPPPRTPRTSGAPSASCSSSSRGRSVPRTGATSCVRRRTRLRRTCSCSRRSVHRSAGDCATAAPAPVPSRRSPLPRP